jgi:hypothetical protein
VRPRQPTITGNVGIIEETKPLDVTCTTTGSRPRTTCGFVSPIVPTFPVIVGGGRLTEIIQQLC